MTPRIHPIVPVLLALAALAASCAYPERRVDVSARIGKPVPDWGRLEWTDGRRPARPKDFLGSVVVLHWWTDGCPDCVESLDLLNRLHARHSGRGLEVVGMYFPVPEGRVRVENIREAAEFLGLRFPVAIDEDWDALEAFGLEQSDRQLIMPTVVIDRDGLVEAILAGSRINEEDAQRLDAMLVQLLGRPAPN